MQLCPTEPDAAAIEKILEAWGAGWRDGDAAALAALFTEDGTVMPQNSPEIAGRDAIRAAYQQVFDAYSVSGDGKLLELEVAGHWAYFRSTYTLTATPKDGGESTNDVGKWLCILERQPDRSWKILRLMANSDLPPASGPR